VSKQPSSGVLKTVTAGSGTGHNISPATTFQCGQVEGNFAIFQYESKNVVSSGLTSLSYQTS